MNTVDNIKIISLSVCENSLRFAMLSCCLKSPLGLLTSHNGYNPNVSFYLRMISRMSKKGKCTIHHIHFDKKTPRQLFESPYLAQRLSPSHVIPQLRSGMTLIRKVTAYLSKTIPAIGNHYFSLCNWGACLQVNSAVNMSHLQRVKTKERSTYHATAPPNVPSQHNLIRILDGIITRH